MNAIGLVEVKNISKGVKVTDEMLKSAGVFLIQSGGVCPGKFVTIVGGKAMEIQAAVEAKVGSDIEVVMVNGGQPVYYYIISVE